MKSYSYNRFSSLTLARWLVDGHCGGSLVVCAPKASPCDRGKFRFLREVWHESVVFTSSTSIFEGSLARMLLFHILSWYHLRDIYRLEHFFL